MAKKTQNNYSITVIVPMHDYSDANIKLLKTALDSVPSEIDVTISCKHGTDETIFNDYDVNVISTSNGDSFQELVNAAVDEIKTDWFSILEFDDTYTNIWFDNVRKYIDYMPNVSVFLPLEDITEFDTKKYIGFGNEAPWASSFSNKIGYIDLDSLQSYFDFYLTGSVFNTNDWKIIGGLKPLIKGTFWYEWMLRAANSSKKLYVIPKVGYNHALGRKGSLVDRLKNELTDAEARWWFELAKKDYFFKEQKEPSYYVYKEEKDED